MNNNKIVKPISKFPLVVNLLGPPGSGKSTGAAYIFSMLKMSGINAELVTEFAKDKAWEHNDKAIENQSYVFGEQYYRMSRCENEVDVIVTDSPLFLSIIYNRDKRSTENFNESVMDIFNSYNNLNILLQRTKPYEASGRFHTELESEEFGIKIENALKKYCVPYTVIDGDIEGYDKIVDLVMDLLYRRGVESLCVE